MTDQVYYKVQYPLKKAIGIIKEVGDNPLVEDYSEEEIEKINNFVQLWEEEGREKIKQFIKKLRKQN